MLFEMGLGDRVVGVTRYCDYPPEALAKVIVGGYFDVNYERLLSLEPDLVILLEEHQDAIHRLEELTVPTLAVDHSRVSGILGSITTIADRCEVKDKGKELRNSLEGRIHEIQERYSSVSPRPRVPTFDGSPPYSDISTPPSPDQGLPRVLVAVGRLMDKGTAGEIFVSGRDGFYDDLIALAGGVNAYREETLKFPVISEEGLVRLDPDIILEMVPDLSDEKARQSLMKLWRGNVQVRAVREGRVYILGEDYVVVPGPRFINLLEDMAKIINSRGIDDQ
jgi:iron complex transport system substrate-binding protein